MILQIPIVNTLLENLSTFIIILSTMALSSLVSWLRNKKPKKVLSDKIDTIVSQVTTNGGASIGDRVDKLIRGQDAQFAVMLNLYTEPLFRADKNGLWTFCNHKMTDIFGMYQREMIGRGWEIAIGKNVKERNEFVTAWNEFFKEQSPLNHQAYITNQETKESNLYLFTARQIIEDGEFQFFLGKVTVIEKSN